MTDWREQFPQRNREIVCSRLLGSIKQLGGSVEEKQLAAVARNFENQIWINSTTKEQYFHRINEKLKQLEQQTTGDLEIMNLKRKAQEATKHVQQLNQYVQCVLDSSLSKDVLRNFSIKLRDEATARLNAQVKGLQQNKIHMNSTQMDDFIQKVKQACTSLSAKLNEMQILPQEQKNPVVVQKTTLLQVHQVPKTSRKEEQKKLIPIDDQSSLQNVLQQLSQVDVSLYQVYKPIYPMLDAPSWMPFEIKESKENDEEMEVPEHFFWI